MRRVKALLFHEHKEAVVLCEINVVVPLQIKKLGLMDVSKS